MGGWFAGADGGGLRGDVSDGRGLLSDSAAALRSQVTGLGSLAGDASALVVHRSAAVEMFTDLDPGAGVGAAPWAGRDGYDAAPQGDDVVLADSAPVAEAEDVSRVLASRKAAVGGTWLCWRLAKACVVPCQESGQRGVGLLKSGDVGQPQLLVEAVLEGAPEGARHGPWPGASEHRSR